MKPLLSFLLCAAALSAAAQDAAPVAAPDGPAANVTAAVQKSAPPKRRTLPPEAFTTPTNFIALVNYPGAVDQGWLEEQAALMQRSLSVGVKAVPAAEVFPEDPKGASHPDRAEALAMLGTHEDWKIVVLLANPFDDDPIPPILASPYENWVIMDAAWVRRGGGDADLVNDRMGKRLYQAIGACCGAAYHPEPQAVMRYSPTPQSLDACLSHNFHPLNLNAFSIVARAVGLDQIRLRPRKELEELGIIKPRPPKPEEGKQDN